MSYNFRTATAGLLFVFPSCFGGICLLAGAIRAGSGLAFWPSALLATATLLLLLFFQGQSLASRFPKISPAYFILFLVCFSFCLFELYYRPFFGLVSVGGGDAGNHINFKNLFLADSPYAYHGFAGFFSLDAILQKIFQLDDFGAVRLTYYFCIYLLLIPPFICLAQLTRQHAQKYSLLALGLLALLAYFPAQRIVLPLWHYLQADGFYPQFVGLLPLFFVWPSLAFADSYRQRLFVAVVFSTIYRFAYALNLGDLLISIGLLNIYFATVQHCEKREKIIAAFVAAIFISAGIVFLIQLTSVSTMVGAVLPTRPWRVVAGLSCLAGTLFATPFFLKQIAPARSEAAICMFPGCFAATNAAVQMLHLIFIGPATYYIYKYSFHAVSLTVAATVIAATVTALAMLQARKLAGWCLALLTVMLLGLWQLKIGYAVFRPSYVERSEHVASPSLLQPQSDDTALKMILARLSATQNDFGGFITPSWTASNFINASLGFYGERPLFEHGKVDLRPGSCVFFKSSESDLDKYRAMKHARVYQRVVALLYEKHLLTEDYSSAEGLGPMKLSSVCLPRR